MTQSEKLQRDIDALLKNNEEKEEVIAHLETVVDEKTTELQRLKDENGRYKRAYDQQYKQLIRLLEDQILLVKKFGDDQGAVNFDDRFLARHKAEQAMIDAALGYRRSLNGEDSCSEEFWLQEIENAAEALDAAATGARTYKLEVPPTEEGALEKALLKEKQNNPRAQYA